MQAKFIIIMSSLDRNKSTACARIMVDRCIVKVSIVFAGLYDLIL